MGEVLGRLKVAGSGQTLIYTPHRPGVSFDVERAALYRVAIDLGARDRFLSSLAPGQSEHVSRARDRRTRSLAEPTWRLATSRLVIEEENAERLVLEPAPDVARGASSRRIRRGGGVPRRDRASRGSVPPRAAGRRRGPGQAGKVAASASLRERGIVDGMGVAEALDRAPEARWVRTDMGRAREVSGSLRAAVRREVEAVELEGLAGFYMRAPVDPADGESWAGQLIESVMRQTGLPLRVGVAPARSRPGLRPRMPVGTVPGSSMSGFEAYLLALPLARSLRRPGRRAARRSRGRRRAEPALTRPRAARHSAGQPRRILQPAAGEDPKPLRVRRRPVSLSREETLEADRVDEPVVRSSIHRLTERLESALRRDGLSAGRIALRLAGPGERTLTRSRSLEAPVADASPCPGRPRADGPGRPRRARFPPRRDRAQRARSRGRRRPAARLF